MRPALVLLLTAAALARAELQLVLAAPETLPFGEPCLFRLTLTNRGPGEETIPSVDEVRWRWRISHVARPNHDTRVRATGGSPAFGRVPPPRPVRLAPGESRDFALRSTAVWEGFLLEGEYEIQVHYEKEETAVRDTRRVRVLFDAARDVPRLIGWLGHKDWIWRLTSHGYLSFLTQDKMLWDYQPTPRTRPVRAIRRATDWWNRDKDKVVLRDGRFEPK